MEMVLENTILCDMGSSHGSDLYEIRFHLQKNWPSIVIYLQLWVGIWRRYDIIAQGTELDSRVSINVWNGGRVMAWEDDTTQLRV